MSCDNWSDAAHTFEANGATYGVFPNEDTRTSEVRAAEECGPYREFEGWGSVVETFPGTDTSAIETLFKQIAPPMTEYARQCAQRGRDECEDYDDPYAHESERYERAQDFWRAGR